MSECSEKKAKVGWTAGQYQAALGIGYFLLIAWWSVGIIFHGAPDESTHFFLLEYLKAYHSLPAAAEPVQAFTGSISGYTWRPGEFWYHGLPFPHVVAALVTSYGFGWLLPSDFGYLAARSCNWLMGAVFICALFRFGYRAGMPKQAAAVSAVIICLIPQVSFVFSYFNSDAFGLMSIALMLSALSGFFKSPNKGTALLLGASLGLMFMTKLYMLPAVVFAVIMFGAYCIVRDKSIARFTFHTLIACVVVCAPLLITTYLKYGEISGISGQMDFVALHKNNPAIHFGTCYLSCPDNFFEMTTLKPWLSLALQSYFSVTGWMNIYIPYSYYTIALSIFIALIISALANTVRAYLHENKSDFLLRNLLPFIMAVGLFPSIVVLSIIASQNTIPQPQGRYLFVTIPFMMVLAAIAVADHRVYSNTISAARAENFGRFKTRLLFVIAAWMLWTNMVAWSQNTLYAPNLAKSAIGYPVTQALLASGAFQESNPSALDPQQLLERLQINNNQLVLEIPDMHEPARGHLDEVRKTPEGLLLRGWTYVEQIHGSPLYVISVESGKITGAIAVNLKRPDVAKALDTNSALQSGFSGTIPTAYRSKECSVKLYTVSSTFKIFAMPDVCESISRSSH